MFHQFNKVTGRLIAASNLQAPLFPITPIPLQRVEAPPIQHTAVKLSTVAESCAAPKKARLMPGTNIPYPPVPESIRKKQELFQRDNDEPVFLKGGGADKLLYRLTMALCILGVVGVAENIYKLAFPNKP